MRKTLSIILCRLLRFAGKLLGRGSSLPGRYALKVCPDVLGRVKLPPCVIAVTGSNGKTSTVEMIAAVLRGQGKQVIYNAEGSNQIEGVTTLVLSHCSLGGRVRGDVLLLESDERYARYTFRYFHPPISSSPICTGTSSPGTATPSGCTMPCCPPSTRTPPWSSTPTTPWSPASPGATKG